jgi:hypothetical protein
MKKIIILLFFLPLLGAGQSLNLPSKSDLTRIYSQGIADFIKAVNEKHKTSFDTLFFGKHVYGQPDDFPDIELPKTIENIQIRLISPEVGLKKQKACKSLVYVNMVGWVGQEKAEFIFVTFSNGCKHQYDCFINYKYDSKQKEFDLDNLRFEYYLYKNKP